MCCSGEMNIGPWSGHLVVSGRRGSLALEVLKGWCCSGKMSIGPWSMEQIVTGRTGSVAMEVLKRYVVVV